MVGRRLLGRKALAAPGVIPGGGVGRTSTIIDEKILELKAAQKTHSGRGKPPGGTAIVLPMWSPKRFAKWTQEESNSADAVWSSSEEVNWPGEDWWLRLEGGSAEEQTENHHLTSQQEGTVDASLLRQTPNNGQHLHQQQRRKSDLAFTAIPLSTLHQYANTNDAMCQKSSLVAAGSTSRDPKSRSKAKELMSGGADDIDHIIDLTSITTRITTSINDIRQVAKSGGLPMQVIDGILQPAADSRDNIFHSPSPPPEQFSAAAAAATDSSNAKVRKRGWQKNPHALLPPPSSSSNHQTTATSHLELEQQKSLGQNRNIFHRHQHPLSKKETRFRDELDPIVSSRTPSATAGKLNKTVFGNDFNIEEMNDESLHPHHGSNSPLLLLKSSSSSSNGASAWFGGLLEEEPDCDQQQQHEDYSTGGTSSTLSPEFSADGNYRILPGVAPPNNNNEPAADMMLKKKRAFLASRRAAATAPLRTRGDSLFMEQIGTKSPKRTATTDRRTPSVSNMKERLLDREIIEVDRLLSALRPMVDRSGNSSSNGSNQQVSTTRARPEQYHPLSPLGVRIDQRMTPPCRTDQREPEGDLLGILGGQQQRSPPEDKSSVAKAAAYKKVQVRISKQAESATVAPAIKEKNPETQRPSSSTEKEKESLDAVLNDRMTSPNDSLLDADTEDSDENALKDAPPADVPAKTHIAAKPSSSSLDLSAERRGGAVSDNQAIQGMNDHRKSKSGPYCESECASAFQPACLVRTEEEASSFCTNARSDLAIHTNYFAPPIEGINDWSKDSVGVEVQLKTFNGPHYEQDECSLFSSLQSVVIPEEREYLERKPSNEEYKSWNPYTMYGGSCRDAQPVDNNGDEGEWMPPMRRTHPSPHHDYWKSFSTIKTLGSFDSLSVIDEVDGVISDESRILNGGSRDAIERKREGVEGRRDLFGRNHASRYYAGMTHQSHRAPLPETPASSIWVNDCASQRSAMMQTASSMDNPSPLRTNLRAGRGKAGFIWNRGVWQPQTDHIRGDTTLGSPTSPMAMPTSDDEIPRPLADSVLYLMSPLLSGDTEDVTALTEDDGKTTVKGDDDATDAAPHDCSFMCGGCTWNLNGIFC